MRSSLFVSLRVIAMAALLSAAVPAGASADELSAVFDQLLANPADPALNLRYAELVEQRGDMRKALAAYERAMARNPGDPQLLRGYRRVKRKLQPAVTAWTASSGLSWASNPRQLPGGDARREDDVSAELALLMFDERTLAGHRWRTLAGVQTQLQDDIDELGDAVASLGTGPVFDIGDHSRLHIAPGAEVAWLDGDWLYHDILVKATFETLYKGATQSITASIAHRETNSKFLGDDGIVFDLTARFAAYNKLRKNDSIYFMPRFRVSEPGGEDPGRIYTSPLLPGNFVEAGGRLVYYMPVARNRVFVGAGFGAYHRSYDQNVAFETTDREDWLLEPTAHLVFPKVAGTNFDFRIDYRFEHNDSNDPFEDYDNHVVGARTVRRF